MFFFFKNQKKNFFKKGGGGGGLFLKSYQMTYERFIVCWEDCSIAKFAKRVCKGGTGMGKFCSCGKLGLKSVINLAISIN